MKFDTNGMYAYCITETDEGCIINNAQGYVMEADQMIDIAQKMIKYAKKHKSELKLHNIQRQQEWEQEMNSFKHIKKPTKQKQTAYVYFFECGGYYKIGYSKNIERRITELDKRPHKLEVVCVSRSINNAFDVEQNIHNKLKNYRVNGEWYDLPEDVVKEVCCYINQQK